MNVDALEVKEGDPIPEAWQRLKDWVAGLPEIKAHGDGAAVHYDPRGAYVVYDADGDAYIGHFHCSLVSSDSKQRITVGKEIGDSLVNGSLVPVIDKVPIDGMISASKTLDRPQLDLSSGPNADLRSWVCLQAVVDLKTGKLDEKNPFDAPLTIVHRNDYDQLDPGADDNGYGLDALAMLIWRDNGTVDRVQQIVMHQLLYDYKPPLKKGGKGRHFFRGT